MYSIFYQKRTIFLAFFLALSSKSYRVLFKLFWAKSAAILLLHFTKTDATGQSYEQLFFCKYSKMNRKRISYHTGGGITGIHFIYMRKKMRQTTCLKNSKNQHIYSYKNSRMRTGLYPSVFETGRGSWRHIFPIANEDYVQNFEHWDDMWSGGLYSSWRGLRLWCDRSAGRAGALGLGLATFCGTILLTKCRQKA